MKIGRVHALVGAAVHRSKPGITRELEGALEVAAQVHDLGQCERGEHQAISERLHTTDDGELLLGQSEGIRGPVGIEVEPAEAAHGQRQHVRVVQLSRDDGRLFGGRDPRLPRTRVLLAEARIGPPSQPLEREQPGAGEGLADPLETLVQVSVDRCSRRLAGESTPVHGRMPRSLQAHSRARLVVAQPSP